MNRRDAIGRVALLMGGAVIGAEFFVSGCKSGGSAPKVADLFLPDNVAFLDEVADTILPTTSSPGAKAAQVGHFMAVMVQDCYTTGDQETFLEGIGKLNDASDKKFSKKFMELTPQQRTDLLVDLDKEQKEYTAKKNKDAEADAAKHKGEKDYKAPEVPNHYFKMMKELTLLGYFTSEIGATKALRYIAVPGHYDGNVPYKKGDKAWAT
ncbi:MAG: gluconate 2-dehydrogenase subunit 3 family protein [Mucilaginibacter sp.]|uniref:gluconate 2-dehydrogenase subunit 3 family protein n=1 Tax=Mucilaginibacter sp. L3T2-6 TaxID=3062491 RepID=UPI00267602F6|nr:gluconate 2-dehydrogenase subunit 3 family protein [Mucilaginibacter sp. L3T2-6]MDO3644130.1 gluconate 2-dehydrogenase subunit 3 family protein [Mucilaginibacter sp. L3T2-6]MDV6216589.1 gluconate 2-dehydrogenase subunit 3 family protein [Mucilaginibacter sp. L3T2-6]